MSDREPEQPPPNVRRVEFGRAVKPGRFEPAAFLKDGDGEKVEPLSEGDRGILNDAREILARLEGAKVREIAEAVEKLKKGAKVSLRERRLVEGHARDLKVQQQGDGGGGDAGGKKVNSGDVEGAVERLNAWWVNGDAKYQVCASGRWLEVDSSKLALMLKRAGLAPFPLGEGPLSPVEEAVLHVTENRVLDISVPDLAGYPAGVREMRGCQILVRRGPRLVVPKEGEWTFIDELVGGRLLLPEEEGRTVEQRMAQVLRFHWWLARGVENLYSDSEERLDTHVLILAGPPKSSKSRLQHSLITPVLGGLYGDPSKYFFGESTFNEGWIGKGHLLIEDPNPSSKMFDRLKFGQCLKGHTVNAGVTLHPKGKSEFGVQTRHRISISVNNHPDSLKVLPPLSSDFRDKALLLQVFPRPLSMPTRTLEERREFKARIEAELPAYVWWLLHDCVVPEAEQEDRCGFRAFWDPELRSVLWEDTPTSEFLTLVDVAAVDNPSLGKRTVFEGDGSWSGEGAVQEFGFRGEKRREALALALRATKEGKRLWIGGAADIQKLLLHSQYADAVKKVVSNNNVGAMLGRLAAEMPERVANFKTSTQRLYVIIAAEAVEVPVTKEENGDDFE